MKRKTKYVGLAGAVLALSMTVVGCSSGGAGNGTSTKTTSGGTSSLTLVDVPAPYGSFQPNFNPYSSSANPGTQGFIYEPLFYFDPISNHTYPLLGKSETWSNGNKTLTVDLQNADWSDGKPFTAADVVFTFNMLKKYPAADSNGVWQELSSVTANGQNQVVFQFKSPDVPFADYVLETYIVPLHIWSKLGDPSKASITNPIGTGPYVLSKFTSQDYKLTANPHYWGGDPPVKTIDFPSYDGNNSADLALAQDQVDWGGAFIPNIKQVFTSKSPDNHYWFPPANDVMLYTNLKDPELSQLAVRKAISMAIDRQQLSTKGEYGYEPVANPTGVITPTDQSMLDQSLPAADLKFTYDPQGAEKVLQQAGFKKNSNGIYVSPSGKPLSFTLDVISGWSDWDADASMMAQQLQQIGIQVTVHQDQYGAFMNNLRAHHFQLAMYSTQGAGPGMYYTYDDLLATGNGWNVEQWSSPVTDNALKQFASTTDTSKQQQALNVLEKAVAEQIPSIPLLEGVNWYEYSTAHFTGWPTESNPYVNPAPWAWPAPEILVMHLKPKS